MNLVWLEADRLAACRGPRSVDDLSELRRIGIGAVVRLADIDEQMVSSAEVHGAGMDDLAVPVEDFQAPTQPQLEKAVRFINEELARGRAVAVTCGAGYGRTSTVLACYLVATRHLSAREAIQQIRSVCRREPENTEQREAVYRFDRGTR
jgi:atypical dual specificity phosphatase